MKALNVSHEECYNLQLPLAQIPASLLQLPCLRFPAANLLLCAAHNQFSSHCNVHCYTVPWKHPIAFPVVCRYVSIIVRAINRSVVPACHCHWQTYQTHMCSCKKKRTDHFQLHYQSALTRQIIIIHASYEIPNNLQLKHPKTISNCHHVCVRTRASFTNSSHSQLTTPNPAGRSTFTYSHFTAKH